MEDRPRISTLISSLANYSNTIPPAANDMDARPAAAGAKMGTLIGVYLPCIQNIFGVILFIRLTWVVGTAGAVQGFLIVLTCCCAVSQQYTFHCKLCSLERCENVSASLHLCIRASVHPSIRPSALRLFINSQIQYVTRWSASNVCALLLISNGKHHRDTKYVRIYLHERSSLFLFIRTRTRTQPTTNHQPPPSNLYFPQPFQETNKI